MLTPLHLVPKWKSVILFNKAKENKLYCHDRINYTQASFSESHTCTKIAVMVSIGSTACKYIACKFSGFPSYLRFAQ